MDTVRPRRRLLQQQKVAARVRTRLLVHQGITFGVLFALSLAFFYSLTLAERVAELVVLDERSEYARSVGQPGLEAPGAVTVTITAEEILLDGLPVATIAGVADEYLTVPALEEALRVHRARSGGSSGAAWIRAKKTVQFRVVKRVMFTCAAAGYGDISFSVLP